MSGDDRESDHGESGKRERDRDGERITRVLCTLCALGAHLTGECVVLALMQGRPELVSEIECWMSPSMSIYLESLLQADFVVERVANGLRLHHLPHPCGLGASPATVCIVVNPVHAKTLFDWESLAATTDGIYLTSDESPRTRTLMDVLLRVQRRRFSLVCRLGHRPQVVAGAMIKACGLIGDGWIMDDACCGRVGWVVAKWGHLLRKPEHVRADHAACSPSLHSSCPICYDLFQSDDCVVNLPCNHNFHVTCGGTTRIGGICEWIAADKTSCPCCRASIFS